METLIWTSVLLAAGFVFSPLLALLASFLFMEHNKVESGIDIGIVYALIVAGGLILVALYAPVSPLENNKTIIHFTSPSR